MAESQVSICNLALTLVGGNTIEAIDDGSEEARVCSVLFDSTRRELLGDNLWTFARARSSLAASTTAPVWGYDAAFPKPSDCLAVFAIDSGSRTAQSARWAVEGDNVVANASAPLRILYSRDITDVSKFPPLFAMYLAHRIALYICEAQTEKAGLHDRLEAAAERIFARAMATDAVQSTEMLDSDGEWVRAHYADGGSDPTVIWSDW
ncbi:MAG: hypothetical protein KC616_21655 [Myxococcales bacterium]|nr:hypothetical protein [Myxococcales bacterium]